MMAGGRTWLHSEAQLSVMLGLVPSTHALFLAQGKTWIVGTGPTMTIFAVMPGQ